MTTDRELLELAAKAAGIAFEWDGPVHCGYYSEWRGLPQWNDWNPLTDDGDALRLAVKLSILVDPSAIDGTTDCVVPHIFYDGVPHGDDPYAATRRAIVRAAAAIGVKS